MERVLEKANDPRLEQTLEYHAAASTSPGRAREAAQAARASSRPSAQDDVAALDRWEQTLRASPSDPDALAALSELYERAQRWPELAQILERLDGGKPLPRAGHARGRDARARARALRDRRSTRTSATRARAIKAWHRVLELTPKQPQRARRARPAVPRAHRSGASSPTCSARRSRRSRSSSRPTIASARARRRWSAREILEERLGAPAEAIKVLEQPARASSTRTTSRRTPRCAGCTRRAATSTPRCASPSARCTCRPSRCGRSRAVSRSA